MPKQKTHRGAAKRLSPANMRIEAKLLVPKYQMIVFLSCIGSHYSTVRFFSLLSFAFVFSHGVQFGTI